MCVLKTSNALVVRNLQKTCKIDDFYIIRNSVCDFLLVIDSNIGTIFHRFRDTATYSLKISIEYCGQSAADGDIITIDSL